MKGARLRPPRSEVTGVVLKQDRAGRNPILLRIAMSAGPWVLYVLRLVGGDAEHDLRSTIKMNVLFRRRERAGS
jgi:hypothetical protein